MDSDLEKKVAALEAELKTKEAYIQHLENLSEAYTNLSDLFNQELRDADRTLKAQEIIQNMMEQERRDADQIIQVHENLVELSALEKKQADETIKAHESVEFLTRMEKEEADRLIKAQEVVSTLSVQELTERDEVLRRILAINRKLSSILDKDLLLGEIVESMLKVTRSVRGGLILHAQGRLELQYSIGLTPEEAASRNFAFSRDRIQDAARTGKAVLIKAHDHPEKNLSILAIPLVYENELLGVIYGDIPGNQDVFHDMDIFSAEIFTSQAAISLHNAVMYESIRQKNGELLKLVNLKNQFLTLLSNDMSRPVELLEKNLQQLQTSLSPETATIVDKTSREVGRIRNTLTKILAIEKLEAEVNDLFKDVVNFEELCRLCLANHKAEADRRHISVSIDLAEAFRHFKGSETILRVVMDELISNSIYYNRENGTVTIRGTEKNHTLTLEISDTGHGIKPENLERIFEQFGRTEESAELNARGAGLGLFMVRNSVQYYGGNISVRSVYGEGTTFTLTFLNH